MRMIKRLSMALMGVAVLGLAAGEAQAKFPDEGKRFRWILGFGAGGASDFLARTVAKELEKVTKTKVVIENRRGASGIIGAGVAAKAKPDGYTFVLVSSSYFNNAALGSDKFTFKPVQAFEPVTILARTYNIVVVNKKFPVKSVKELIDYAKKNPGKINYSSGGIGTGTHFETEYFQWKTGTKMVHIPFKGAKNALLDVMAGRIPLMFSGAAVSLPQIRAGKVRPLAVLTPEPVDELPGIPTVNQTVKGFSSTVWYALFAPKGTPRDRINYLNKAFGKALSNKSLIKTLGNRGFKPTPSTPEGMLAKINEHLKLVPEVAQKTNFRLKN
ncbi:MAG: tripartite tricarboxylate transporter substrate binding protein [Rhodospirillales bacterium]